MERELKMTVSPICSKDGEKYAFVLFAEGDKQAEGKIPDCVILSSQGFSDDEVQKLESYMKRELRKLKEMAAGIHVLDSFFKEN